MKEAQRYITMFDDLNSGTITPRSVVGGGFKNARKVAMEWIQTQLHNALNAQSTVCQLHGNSQGQPFKTLDKSKESPVFKMLNAGEYKMINDAIVSDFGVCKASVGSGFLVFVKTKRRASLSQKVK